MSLQTTTAARPISVHIVLLASVFAVAVIAAWGFPRLDHAVTGTAGPGLISFLGVGLVVLGLTTLLLVAGVRRYLPKTGVFLAAALGYNALLISVKFGLGPLSLYAAESRNNGFFILTNPLAFPGLAAITAILYAVAFFVLYSVFRNRLQRRLGVKIAHERRLVQLIVVMFVLAVVGGVTAIGLLGFLEYSLSVLFTSVLGLLIAIALIGAIVLCSVSFREAADQAVMLRNVSLLTTFAWIGLAFIAAYHILWLIFLLTLISLWPLQAWSGK